MRSSGHFGPFVLPIHGRPVGKRLRRCRAPRRRVVGQVSRVFGGDIAMRHSSRLSNVLLSPTVASVLVLVTGAMLRRESRWPSLHAFVSEATWTLFCAALVWLVLRGIARLASDLHLPAAEDDDAYYRRYQRPRG